jgi:hypothetical protein
MANPEHLQILERGVKTWNKWRREYPDVDPDISDTVLDGANLGGAKTTTLSSRRLRACSVICGTKRPSD